MGVSPVARGAVPMTHATRRLKVDRLDADGNETGRAERSGDLACGSGACQSDTAQALRHLLDTFAVPADRIPASRSLLLCPVDAGPRSAPCMAAVSRHR